MIAGDEIRIDVWDCEGIIKKVNANGTVTVSTQARTKTVKGKKGEEDQISELSPARDDVTIPASFIMG
jgi:hypothetical protein